MTAEQTTKIREIKFRAWHKGYPASKMLTATSPAMIYEKKVGDSLRWLADGQPVEVMQYTGLKDKNGKEIYEGDILEIDGFGRVKPIMDVRWESDYAMWVVYPDWLKNKKLASPEHVPLNAYLHPAMEEMMLTEVIGNIYEHPRLLK